MKRASFALLALLAAPAAAQQTTGLPFLMPPESTATEESVAFYDNTPYVPVRRGEVYSAGFLSEGRELAFGKVLGPTRPPQVAAQAPGAEMTRGAIVAIEPPAGVSWASGDTVVFAVRRPAPKGWGEIVVPTGLGRVVSATARQTQVSLLAIYGPVRRDQVVYELPAFTPRGEVVPVAVPNGARGSVIGFRDRRELAQTGGHMFIDLGSEDGIVQGDFVEIRRKAGPRRYASDTIDELMGRGQVVNVGRGSSTIRLIGVVSPDIAMGTPVVRVATLP